MLDLPHHAQPILFICPMCGELWARSPRIPFVRYHVFHSHCENEHEGWTIVTLPGSLNYEPHLIPVNLTRPLLIRELNLELKAYDYRTTLPIINELAAEYEATRATSSRIVQPPWVQRSSAG